MGMVKRFKASARFGMVMTGLFLTLGCSSSANKFIGTWKDKQHNVALEIRRDHTCVKIIPGYSGSARWELVDDNNIKITYGKGGADSENATLKDGALNFEGLVMTK